jgi:protein involved in polysaccharide export with SLBB domain
VTVIRAGKPDAAWRRRVTLSPFHLVTLSLLALGGAPGCAAVTNPVADAVPVRLLPPEFLAPPRDGEHTVPLTLLGQPQPADYRLAAGDVLGVYVDGFLGERTQPLPMHVAPLVQVRDQRRLPPALGYPLVVQDDGKIMLPMVGAVSVQGMTVNQAAAAIRKAYLDAEKIKADVDRVVVTLLNPRQQHVIVFRQEAANLLIGPEGVTSGTKRGTGQEVDLPAYENDVLHALAVSGGLPGLDAYDEVIIYRHCFRDGSGREAVRLGMEAQQPGHAALALGPGVQAVHIPLRLPPGAPLPVRPEDVVLHTGDVVFLEGRDREVFYTAGLLPPGAHVLPRDYDLDVVSAISQVHGPLVNGGFAVSNLSGALIAPGFGAPSPSLLTVIRKTPHGGQVPIQVDLDRALCDARERILVQAGDVLILQEKPEQALARWFTQVFLNFNLVWEPFHSRFATGVIDVAAPDRLPSRVGTVTIPQQ